MYEANSLAWKNDDCCGRYLCERETNVLRKRMSGTSTQCKNTLLISHNWRHRSSTNCPQVTDILPAYAQKETLNWETVHCGEHVRLDPLNEIMITNKWKRNRNETQSSRRWVIYVWTSRFVDDSVQDSFSTLYLLC